MASSGPTRGYEGDVSPEPADFEDDRDELEGPVLEPSADLGVIARELRRHRMQVRAFGRPRHQHDANHQRAQRFAL